MVPGLKVMEDRQCPSVPHTMYMNKVGGSGEHIDDYRSVFSVYSHS